MSSPHTDDVIEAHGMGQCFLFDACPACDDAPRPTRDEEREAMADIRWHEDREEGRC
jgi:hypothetical protein